jgi:hypothetical protein
MREEKCGIVKKLFIDFALRSPEADHAWIYANDFG